MAASSPAREAATRPSVLHTVNVETPVAAAICRSVFLSWAILVRKSLVAVDGVEGLAEVVGEGVGGGDGLPSGLDLDGAVAAGGLDEFPD